ncbi:hypothetical protein Vretifemale_6217 [Volvox reticuliferus]|uniref:SH3 domain-containing protein n=3 Tax=Volvox reticuliferus TaxID=1737510 RepID=A0A8J4C6V0_9CHLO|nr:hypothetical protein Vretifemale_6217 [Volvox reticuliferus]
MQKPPPQRGTGMPQGEDPTPTYNNYIRSSLGKGESANHGDHFQGLVALKAYDEKQSDIILKQLSRLLQYGYFTIAGLQQALQVQRIDIGRDEKGLMRIVQHLVLLGLGDGSAGTPLPVPQTAGGMFLAKAVDRLGLEVLVAAWNDLGNERATFLRKQAALRALAAITRASLTSSPDDATYAQGLYETLRGLLDKVDALRAGRRGLAHIISQAHGNRKKNLIADMRQRVEMWSLLRGAFAAARLALPRSALYKVAQRSLSALGSSDPVCARHALALASLVARDPSGCGSFIAAVEPLLRHNVETAKRTGALHLGIMPAKRSGGSSAGDPTQLPDSESHLNLRDTWARVYLARACAAVIQSGHIAGDVGDRGAVFWQALLLLAVADPSERVALEAIRAMFGAPYPRGTTAAAMRAPGAGARLSVATSPAEVDAESSQSKIMGASWHLVMTQALEQPPVQEPGSSSAGGAPGADSVPPVGAAGVRADDAGIFGRVARRLLRCLQSRSHALICGAARTVAVLAESRAWFHSLSGGHGHEAEPDVVRRWMRALHGFLLMLASDDGLSGCERAAALEALIWNQDQLLTPSPGLLLRAVSHGGFTAPPIARYTFADPWPECLLVEVLGVLARRLRCTAGMPPELVLELAGALAAGSPSGMPREALQALWDLAPGPLAARTALQLLSAPLPPLCQPPAAAAVEVKSMAAQAEMAFNNLKAMAACWLGEHVNNIAGEYAWKPWETKMSTGSADAASAAESAAPEVSEGPNAAPRAPHGGDKHKSAGDAGATDASQAGRGIGIGVGGPEAPMARMAEAAVTHSPLLSMSIAQLNRAQLTGAPVVRVAAAQALGKLAVRSGEPYRIQCYSLLAAAVGRIGGVCGGAAADPLGLAPVVDPTIEVLDAMYAGELVLERHVALYGTRARGWPAAALESLRRRHEWLLTTIGCAVCAVPRDLFLPLGPRSRRLLFPNDKEDAEEDARNAAAAEAQQQQEQYGDQQYYDEFGQPYQYDYSTAEQYDYGDYYNNASQQEEDQSDSYGQQHDPLARYDFTGQKAAAAVELNWGAEQPGAYDGVDDATAVAEARPAVVLYSFQAESEGEVSVTVGDSVRVVHDLGEWFQVLTSGGQQGLVPASYIQLLDEQQGTDSGGGRGQTQGSPLQSQLSVGSGSAAGGNSAQPRQRQSAEGAQSGYGYAYGSGGQQESGGGAAGSTSGYYPYQYDNPEYDAGGPDGTYGSYYGDYGSQYGGDPYGANAYGSSVYGGGTYGDEGGKKKKGFGGLDDIGAVLVEAKNAVAAARQQQQSVGPLGSGSSGGQTTTTPPSPSKLALDGFHARSNPLATQSDVTVYDAVSEPGADTWSSPLQEPAPVAAVSTAADGSDRAKAIYEFVAEMPGELSVSAGEELEIIGGEVDGWYNARVVSDPTRTGIIPASYVQMQ